MEIGNVNRLFPSFAKKGEGQAPALIENHPETRIALQQVLSGFFDAFLGILPFEDNGEDVTYQVEVVYFHPVPVTPDADRVESDESADFSMKGEGYHKHGEQALLFK